MNAKPSDNFFIDLHFSDINRSELMEWAEETFNIKLQRTYFINLDDFCDKIFQCLQRVVFHKQQKQNLLQRIKQKFTQHVK